MNMFVTNPAKDIMSSFFSTILSEVKSALLLVFKAIVKCLCVRMTFFSWREAAEFLFYCNARPIGSYKTINRARLYGSKTTDHFYESVILPTGLFIVSGILTYWEAKDKNSYYIGKETDDVRELTYSVAAYVPFWNLDKFNAIRNDCNRAKRARMDKEGDISDDDAEVNANVINELKILKKWSKSWLWYRSRSIPFTQGLVLHGPPGSGKSTIVTIISRVTGFPIKSISLRCTAQEFSKSMGGLDSRNLILIEDIDAIFHGRENVCDPVNGVDFSTFINALSGVNSAKDYILVITTNKPELLDPALALIPPHGEPVPRPGRIDRVVYVGPLEPDARLKVCKRVLPDRPDLWNDLVLAGEGEVIANFQARCVRVALDLKWAELTADKTSP